MLKRRISLIFTILMLLSLCACDSTSQSLSEQDVEKGTKQSSNLVIGEETILGFYDVLEEVGIDESTPPIN